LLGVTGEFSVCNLLQALPSHAVDVALLLKTIPCLEQVDKRIGIRLIAEIDARVLIVSFPGRSLGGHQRGMAANYEAHFTTLMAGFDYRYDKIEFANEIVFRIFK
jgi:16S rRNA (guanine(1405)-N(7))-methyltransferase